MHPSIEVVKLIDAHGGYKVLPSRKRPPRSQFSKNVDLWIPDLAPSQALMSNYLKKSIHWEDMAFMYLCELKAHASQNLLKPLALMSLRRKLILLCDCPEGITCPNLILATELEECRNRKDFTVMPDPPFTTTS